MTTITYNIPNISCMHCVHTIKTELAEVKGVKSVEAWADKKQATVVFETPANDEQIRGLLTEIGYPPEAA
jgi:copper chaperone CopZ